MIQFNNLDNFHWYCKDCIEFSHGDCLNLTLNANDNEDDNNLNNKCTTALRLEMFNFDYDIHCNAEIDPDNNFSNNISNRCQYYTDHQFSYFQSDKIS